MRMKAAPGALLLIMVLMGCAAPARFNIPAGTSEVVRTDVTANGEALASAGGVGATSWTLAVGSLPAGVKLNADTGVISGKPRRSGTFRFTIVGTDALEAKAAMTYSLRVRRR